MLFNAVSKHNAKLSCMSFYRIILFHCSVSLFEDRRTQNADIDTIEKFSSPMCDHHDKGNSIYSLPEYRDVVRRRARPCVFSACVSRKNSHKISDGILTQFPSFLPSSTNETLRSLADKQFQSAAWGPTHLL